MRSAIFKAAGLPLSIENVADPTPAPDQVVIKVARCGICGSDLTFTDPDSPAHYPVGSALGGCQLALLGLIGLDLSIDRLTLPIDERRSEEHTSELQSLMRISYAVFCLKKKKHNSATTQLNNNHNTMTTLS